MSATEEKDYINVARAVVRKEKKVLMARRDRNQSYSGKWEFPGGKIRA